MQTNIIGVENVIRAVRETTRPPELVVGISTDTHAKQCEFANSLRVTFPMVGDESGLGGRFGGEHQRAGSLRTGVERHRQAARHAPQRAVERQLPEQPHPVERGPRQQILRRQ